MSHRRSRTAMLTGCAVLAGLASMPAIAQAGDEAARVAVAGTVPSWATAQTKTGQADDNQIRHVQVALPLRDRAGAEALAKAVSTPGSPQYGQHLTNREFTARFGPTEADVAKVSEYLRAQGTRIWGVADNRTIIDVSGTVAQLERAFGTQLATFDYRLPDGTWDPNSTRSLVAPETPVTLPAALAGAVSAVFGLDDSGTIVRPAHTLNPHAEPDPADSESCARSWGETNNQAVPQKYAPGRQSNRICGYTAPQVRGMYGLEAGTTGAGTTVAIVGAYNLDTVEADTNRAAAAFGGVPLAAGQYTAVLPERFDEEPACDTADAWHSEQALDVQAVHAIAPAARLRYYAATSCTTVFEALNKAVADDEASVITNSFGNPDENSLPAASRDQFGQIAVQAAIQGQTLLVSTGDTGDSSGLTGRTTASFPASSPWVTAVGGTTVALARNGITITTGWESAGNSLTGSGWQPQNDRDGRFAGGAGGGRSALFATPDYQRNLPAAVTGGRRVLPDVAALADGYTGFAVGFSTASGYSEYSMGGTSLASPLLAGLVADAAQAQGIDRFGFINGALYSMTAGLADVSAQPLGVWTPTMLGFGGVTVPTGEGNYLVDADAKPQTLQSAPGWDPVTGLGTPTAGFLTALGQ